MLSTKLKAAAGNSADATLYVDDVFSTYLYTGNGSTQTITNGIDLAGKGGLVFKKSRNNSGAPTWNDSARGLSNGFLRSDTTSAASGSSNIITAFNSNGFDVGGSGSNAGDTYASWTFRKAAKFFDVVTYTGTGSARTIAHSLGVAPGMIIVKRTDTTGNWQVYHRSLTSAAYSIQLNLTAVQASAPTVWNSTAPTSSVFSVGTDATVNASGGTYVAYLYAHDTSSTGIIQCGSFTTNASGNFTPVNLGWETQYILYKKTNAVGDWNVGDVMRGMAVTNDPASPPPSGSSQVLYPNSSVAEANGIYISPTATGFSSSYSGALSASSTYIYMAIRRPNKPPTTGTQVFSPIATTSATGTKLTTNFVVDNQIFAGRNIAGHNTVDMSRLTGVSTNATESGNNLSTNTTDAEATNNFSLAWDNTGFKICSGFGGGNVIYWNFKRAPGFFDEVCYTGSASTLNVNHNLTVVPELIIAKTRSTTSNWIVYSATLGNAKALLLNDTSGQVSQPSVWNSTTPTSTIVTLGGASQINDAGVTSVMYLFATLAGISKVGSYTGNGTGQAIACGFSAGARFVLIKRTDSTGDWYTFDSTRGLTSGSSPYLLLNSTAAEVTGNNGVYASTGGFTLGATAITTTNIASATYIFLAVA